jgi:Ca2+/Na+ antiporter
MMFLLIPYVALMAMQPPRIASLRLPPAMTAFLSTAIAHSHQNARRRTHSLRAARRDELWLALSIALIIGASFGAVYCAVWLGQHWDIDETIIGMLVLATLTSVPNVVAAIKLATAGHGAAVISESLNSNTLNILAGMALPAVVIGFAAPAPSIVYAAIWLLLMKIVTLIAAGQKRGLSRSGGMVIMVLYLIFAVAVILWPDPGIG